MTAPLATVVETFLAGLLAAGAFIAVGALVERRFAAIRSATPTLEFNLLYFAPASMIQALLGPAAGALTVLAINELGGGLVALPARGWGLLLGLGGYLVAMDLGEYLFHRAQHRFPWLWAMHSLHHSDEGFNVSTTIRHFWLDTFLKTFTIYLAVGVLFKADARIVVLYGILSSYNYFSHMNVRLGFGRLAWVLNSPQYHRRHHSSRLEDRDCNFAALMPVFDILTGAYRRPEAGYYPETGLDEGEGPRSLLSALIWPLRRQAPAATANFQAASPSKGTRASRAAACGLLAVPSRTRPTIPWQMPARRKAL
jgi:sterol desaturase/sphingolipid hydroxylase (fatty acid hydroxylase superfamily)